MLNQKEKGAAGRRVAIVTSMLILASLAVGTASAHHTVECRDDLRIPSVCTGLHPEEPGMDVGGVVLDFARDVVALTVGFVLDLVALISDLATDLPCPHHNAC